MSPGEFVPLGEDIDRYLRHARLGPHIGRGVVNTADPPAEHPLAKMLAKINGTAQPKPLEFDACCLVPVSGPCQIILQFGSDDRLTCNFGENLSFSGQSSDGRFDLSCPQYYVSSTSPAFQKPGWSIASPTNAALKIRYGTQRPVSRVVALINNFDFDTGNVIDRNAKSNPLPILRVVAGGHQVQFERTEHRETVSRFVAIELVPSASITTFSFDAWAGASISDLERFAHNVAGLCSVVAQQHTGIPVLSFFDADGKVIERIVGNPVESSFRKGYMIRHMQLDRGLAQLFRECFDEFARLRDSELWQTMPSFCAGVQDPPYLEQRLASVMAAVERLIRNSLVEAGHGHADEFRPLPELIAAARGALRWDVPKHYTARERYRLNRDAVAHGCDLPHEAIEVHQEFDRWRLFLLRRFLIRLGFTGTVASPSRGWSSMSRVDDFTEVYNSFGKAQSPFQGED